jgi:rhodanese-related sulfurtransferase
MSRAKHSRKKGRPPAAKRGASAVPARPGLPTDPRARLGILIVTVVAAVAVVIAADFVFGAITGNGTDAGSTASPSVAAGAPTQAAQLGLIVQGRGGHWTNVTPGELAEMLRHKDFALVNVMTPYSGEINGTDLYIPYDQLVASASKLLADKSAKILVYCLTGHSSAIAAQTLLDLGYKNVWNLDGGMEAWIASGRTLVNKNR